MSNIRINDFPSRKQYTYAGGAKTFVLDFPFFENTDIFVYVGDPTNNYNQEDPENIITLGIDYTVTGAGLNTGGVVTINDNVDLQIGYTVTIVGWMPIDRFSIYENSSVISMAQLNEDFNRLVVMVKNRNTIIEQTMPKYDRSEVINTIRSNPNTPFSYVNLPLLQANEVWMGNTTGTGLTKGTIPEGGTVGVNVTPQRPSIALWTGTTNNVLTDSNINISGNYFIPVTPNTTIGFDDTTPAMHWPAHVTGNRPVAPQNGDTYYDTTLGSFWGYKNGVWTEFAAGGDNVIVITIDQPAHGFVAGDVVRFDQGTNKYALAQANSAQNAESVGFVKDVNNANQFTIQVIGHLTTGLSGLTPGVVYFLSAVNPGVITANEPSVNGQVSKPQLIADTATSGWILHYRGLIVSDGQEVPEEEGIVVVCFDQVAHGFVVGDCIYNNGSGTYAKATAGGTAAQARAVGIVVEVPSVDRFCVQQSGFTTALSGLTAATQYWLSAATPGLLTATEPSVAGQWSKPMLQAINTTSGWVLPQRPIQVVSAGGGGITQVVSYVEDAQLGPFGVTTIPADLTGFEATITPGNAASTIKILINLNYGLTNFQGTRSVHFLLCRNGVPITAAQGDPGATSFVAATGGDEYCGAQYGDVAVRNGQIVITFMDSPATTSATTYSLQAFVSGVSTNSIYVNRPPPTGAFFSSVISTIFLEEVAP